MAGARFTRPSNDTRPSAAPTFCARWTPSPFSERSDTRNVFVWPALKDRCRRDRPADQCLARPRKHVHVDGQPPDVGRAPHDPDAAGHAAIAPREAMNGDLLVSSLGFLAPYDAAPAWAALLSSVDLFSLWTAILLVIGYRTAAKASTATACFVVAVVWLGYVSIKIGG